MLSMPETPEPTTVETLPWTPNTSCPATDTNSTSGFTMTTFQLSTEKQVIFLLASIGPCAVGVLVGVGKPEFPPGERVLFETHLVF